MKGSFITVDSFNDEISNLFNPLLDSIKTQV